MNNIEITRKMMKRIKLLSTMLILALLTTAASHTYAIYVTGRSGVATTNIARFDIKIEQAGDQSGLVFTKNELGEKTQEYRFCVKARSEVDFSYDLELTAAWDLQNTDDTVRSEHAQDYFTCKLYAYDGDWNVDTRVLLADSVVMTMGEAADYAKTVSFAIPDSYEGNKKVAPVGIDDYEIQNYGIEMVLDVPGEIAQMLTNAEDSEGFYLFTVGCNATQTITE